MPTTATLLWIANAVVFALCLGRQGYRRLWLGILAALLIGPLIWLWWGYLVWRDTELGRWLLRRQRDATWRGSSDRPSPPLG